MFPILVTPSFLQQSGPKGPAAVVSSAKPVVLTKLPTSRVDPTVKLEFLTKARLFIMCIDLRLLVEVKPSDADGRVFSRNPFASKDLLSLSCKLFFQRKLLRSLRLASDKENRGFTSS